MTTEAQAILDWMRGLEQTPGCERAQVQLAAIAESNERLREALNGVLRRYVGLVECGDCGKWDAEAEPEVIAARKALAGTP